MTAAVFFLFLQIVCRNDSNDMRLEIYRRDATFSCRTHSLIPYSLRAVLKLAKSGHCFSRHQNRRRTEERTASNWKPHCNRQSSELHDFFLSSINFLAQVFVVFLQLFSEESGPQHFRKWTVRLPKVNLMSSCCLFSYLLNFYARWPSEWTFHRTEERTASNRKPHYSRQSSELHGFFLKLLFLCIFVFNSDGPNCIRRATTLHETKTIVQYREIRTAFFSMSESHDFSVFFYSY